jgi:AbiV family abortive infection protein
VLKKKRGDPLHSHTKKHALAVRPTTFMGRLPQILGPETCARLQQEAMDGSINRLRETAIYVSCSTEGEVSTPAMEVDIEHAPEKLSCSRSKAQMTFWSAGQTTRTI